MAANKFYQDLNEYVTRLIYEMKGDSDYPLPSENQLAMKFSVSRMTVRKALKDLEDKNIIFKIRGKGTFIKSDGNLKVSPKTVTLVAPTITTKFMEDIVMGLTEYFKKINYSLITMLTLNSLEVEKADIKTALEIQSHGFIIMPIDGEIYNNEILNLVLKKVPVVFIDRKLNGLDILTVSSDHYDMSQRAVRYLCDKGKKNIVFFTPNQRPSSVNQRLEGFKTAIIEQVGELRRENVFSYDDSIKEEEIQKFFETFNFIDGIISPSNHMCKKAIAALKNLNKVNHTDYEILVFDDEISDLDQIASVQTIVQDSRQIGYKSGELIYKIIMGAKDIGDILVPLKKAPPL